MASFKENFSSFAKKPLGFVAITAIIVLLVALALFEIGVLFGALAMILLAFGMPVYLGWNKSFKTLLVVAIVVTAATPPIWAALSNNQLFTPYSPAPTTDGIIQNAHVDPFSYPPAKGNLYHFSLTVHKQLVTYNNTVYSINITAVYLWVTDCPYDGFANNATVKNQCNGNPDYLHEFPAFVLNNSTYPNKVNDVWFNVSLPSNDILYFEMVANYTLNRSGGYSFSCLGVCIEVHGVWVPAASQSYYWNEGPITGSWAYIYAFRLLPTFYLIGAGLGGVLIAVVLVYRWLKIREKRRLAQAENSAGGTPVDGETGCPSCGAVVKGGESFCWKCGKPLEEEKTPETDAKAPLK